MRRHPSSSSTADYAQYQPFFVRDYVLEDDDEGMREAMARITAGEEAIRMHNEALQVIEDAALAKALALSKETALHEARCRVRHSRAHIYAPSPPTVSKIQKFRPNHTSLPASSSSSNTLTTTGSSGGQTDSQPNQVILARVGMISVASIDASKEEESGQDSSTVHVRGLPISVADQEEGVHPKEDPAYVGSSLRSSVDSETRNLSSQIDTIDGTGPGILGRVQDDYCSTNVREFSQELFSNVRFFASPRKCCHCGENVERVYNSESVIGLHAVCISCGTRYCRGCFGPVNCSRDCTSGEDCAVERCCPGVRAIQTFDTLSHFSDAFAVALRVHQEENNSHGYIKTFMRWKDPSIQQFEHTFINTLRSLPRLLRTLSAELHPPIVRLAFMSFLPQVMHDYLGHEDVGDWMLHSNTYLAILEVLREFPTCGLSAVFSEPFACDDKWRGVVPSGADQVTEGRQWSCLNDAVRHLDRRYKQFMALSSRISFPATILKMQRLSDGILYLLLQQIVN
ncbi:hypothetical protein AX15_000467 [Amanita polypyramis BW_CC]|nr:hypothetical protein AX15_000467 [Amanita polypyramis BW_CC]